MREERERKKIPLFPFWYIAVAWKLSFNFNKAILAKNYSFSFSLVLARAESTRECRNVYNLKIKKKRKNLISVIVTYIKILNGIICIYASRF